MKYVHAMYKLDDAPIEMVSRLVIDPVVVLFSWWPVFATGSVMSVVLLSLGMAARVPRLYCHFLLASICACPWRSLGMAGRRLSS